MLYPSFYLLLYLISFIINVCDTLSQYNLDSVDSTLLNINRQLFDSNFLSNLEDDLNQNDSEIGNLAHDYHSLTWKRFEHFVFYCYLQTNLTAYFI